MKKLATLIFAAALAIILSGCQRSADRTGAAPARPIPSATRSLPLVSGHRGANCIAPENTLASADSCIRYGIDVMETDVTISADGVFYLLHDSTLVRTTDGEGQPCEHDSAYLDSLDAGSWFGEAWAGQHLARFEDLLRKAKAGGLEVTVDYRMGDFGDLVALIDSTGMLEHTYFTFSREEDATAFRAQFPDIHTLQGYVTDIRDLDRVMALYSPDIIVNWVGNLDRRFVRKCHDRGLQVLALVLGLDDKTRANRKAVRLGVDVVATDRPEAFRRQFRYDSLGY